MSVGPRVTWTQRRAGGAKPRTVAGRFIEKINHRSDYVGPQLARVLPDNNRAFALVALDRLTFPVGGGGDE